VQNYTRGPDIGTGSLRPDLTSVLLTALAHASAHGKLLQERACADRACLQSSGHEVAKTPPGKMHAAAGKDGTNFAAFPFAERARDLRKTGLLRSGARACVHMQDAASASGLKPAM
jgi:hypothetical protein